MDWVFWAIVGAAAVHIAEEYVFGWMDTARGPAGRSPLGLAGRLAAGIDTLLFALVNAFFILVCVAGALVGAENPTFSLSVACLLLINAAMYIVPMVIVRRYIPGAVSALLLYIPLAAYAFHVVDKAGELSFAVAAGAFLLGLVWQAIPVAAVFLRSARHRG